MPEVFKTQLDGLLLIKPKVFADGRGFFMESWNKGFYESVGINENFVQDNISKSEYRVLRGLHLQTEPYSQGKLIQVVEGEIFDVAVDCRKNSPTFGKYEAITLSEDNKYQLFIPQNFAHGFQVLSDKATILYKCTDFYVRSHERTILWNDIDIGIDWPIKNSILSERDKNGIQFKNLWK